MYNLINLPVTLLFITHGLLHLRYALRLKNHNLKTNVITSILWITAGVLYPFFYPRNNLWQAVSTIIIVFLTPLGIISFLSIQGLIIKKRPLLANYRSIDSLINKLRSADKVLNALGRDVRRKLFHLIPPLLIIILWFIGGELKLPLILTIGYSGLTLFAVFDYARLSMRGIILLPEGLMNVLSRTMKKREVYEPLKVAPLILGLVPFLLLPFPIFISIALIATLSDAAASVIGYSFGKLKFRGKTLEGFIAGAVSAFIIILLSCLILEPSWVFINVIILGFAGALSFFIIDFINSSIDDNVLNPLIIGTVLSIAFLILF